MKLALCYDELQLTAMSLFLIVTSVLTLQARATPNGFTVVPSSVTVAPGTQTEAMFLCQHATAHVLGWSINGTALTRYHLRNITEITTFLPGGATLSRLKILPLSEYDGIPIVCMAAFYDGTTPVVYYTDAVTLLIQDNATSLPTGFREAPNFLDFIINATLIMAIGQEVTYSCQHCEAEEITWKIGGMPFNQDATNKSILLNYTIGTFCGPIYTLTMRADAAFNRTDIICEADIDGLVFQVSVPVQVYIQGPLNSVSNIMRISSNNYSSITYTWTPPFSLDISTAEPNMVFCIKLYDITCVVSQTSSMLVEYNCNVYQPNYTVQVHHTDNRLFEIQVIPRSNVEFAVNGSTESYQDIFIFLNTSDVRYVVMVDYTTGALEQILFIIHSFQNIDQNQVVPAALHVQFSVIDNAKPPPPFLCSLSEVHIDQRSQTAVLNVTNCSGSEPGLMTLYFSQIYISSEGCNDHPLSNGIQLSTHFIQNITVAAFRPSKSSSDEIIVSGNFINISQGIPLGFLSMVYPNADDNNPSIQYGIATRLQDELSAEVSLSIPRMKTDHYQASLFVIDSYSGIPVNRSAATISSTLVRETKQSQNLTSRSDISFRATLSDNGCISCTFLDNSASSCIVIASEKSQLTSEHGLTSIEVFSLIRNGDAASGCISRNLSSLNIAVFTYNGMITGEGVSIDPTQNPPSSGNDDYVAVIISVMAPVVILIVICLVVLVSLWLHLQSIVQLSTKKAKVKPEGTMMIQ